MFDRIGRIDDETPFIVEWFTKQGVEVWSSQEGEQRFENHVDKLMNYIRFWQANGESRKTSTRVKTRLNQLTAEGVYTGGPLPFGYRFVKSGRFNKKGKELLDVEIDEIKAPLVRKMFELTAVDGYGSFRLAEFLNSKGLKTTNGSKFQCNTVNRILKNRMYCGYFISGDIVSPHMERLQIIDEELYNNVQYILSQRSAKNEVKKQVARTTKANTLLSGNIYCAHCGGKLNVTSYVDKHIRADGSVKEVRRQRYTCMNKMRHLSECDGQVAYVASKIDQAVEDVIRDCLRHIKQTPKDIALEERYKKEVFEARLFVKKLSAENEKLKACHKELSLEIGNALIGDSRFDIDTLSLSIKNVQSKIKENETALAEAEFAFNNKQGAMEKLDVYYEQFTSWADEFDHATLEQKKMIACQLISEIKIGRGYELDITLDVKFDQFLIKPVA